MMLFPPREAMNNRRADGGHLDLLQSIMSCLLKIISTMADVCEAICLFRVFCGALNQKIFVFFRVFSWFLFNSLVAV